MTELARYRAKAKITQRQLAASLGVTQGFISQVERGRAMPSLPLARRIEEVTKGEVPMTSWCARAELPAPASPTLAAE